jgi:hypothetical protein
MKVNTAGSPLIKWRFVASVQLAARTFGEHLCIRRFSHPTGKVETFREFWKLELQSHCPVEPTTPRETLELDRIGSTLFAEMRLCLEKAFVDLSWGRVPECLCEKKFARRLFIVDDC